MGADACGLARAIASQRRAWQTKTFDLPICAAPAMVAAHSPVTLVLYRPIGAGDGEERRRNMLGRRHAKSWPAFKIVRG